MGSSSDEQGIIIGCAMDSIAPRTRDGTVLDERRHVVVDGRDLRGQQRKKRIVLGLSNGPIRERVTRRCARNDQRLASPESLRNGDHPTPTRVAPQDGLATMIERSEKGTIAGAGGNEG